MKYGIEAAYLAYVKIISTLPVDEFGCTIYDSGLTNYRKGRCRTLIQHMFAVIRRFNLDRKSYLFYRKAIMGF